MRTKTTLCRLAASGTILALLTAAAQAATVTGTIKTSMGYNPSGAVTVRASNGASTATSGPSWSTYSLAVPDGWSGYLTASFAPSGNYLVNVPAYHEVSNASGTLVKDFTLTVGMVENLSGTVTAAGGGALSNVLVYTSSGTGGGAITGADGKYVFGILAVSGGQPPTPKWSGAVTPLKNGITFTPTGRTYASQSVPVTGCDFVGSGGGGGDTEKPTWPPGASLRATNVTGSTCALVWSAAQDNVGVTGYQLFRHAETSVYATVTGATNTTLTGLSPMSNYTFRVEAYDAAANRSTNGPSVAFTTTNAVAARGKILFTRRVSATDWDLWTMNRDGTEQAVLLDTNCEDRMPRFSNDGGKIVFTRNTLGTGDVYTADAECCVLTNLTADLPNSAFAGRFSWDNAQICFDYYAGEANKHDIYVMNADGSGKRAVVSTAGDDNTPAFSPDNAWLAFQRKTSDSEDDPRSIICKVRTNGTDLVELTDGSELDEMPVFTPDGKYILFKRGGRQVGPPGEIYRMDVNGGNLTNLTNNGVQNDSPAAAPEGDLYAFMAISGGAMEIYTMNPDGTSQTKLTDNSVHDFDPSFSPAAEGGGDTLPAVATNRLAVSRHTSAPPNLKAKIVLMDTDGGNEADLTDGSTYADGIPHFNPQGTRIVFARKSSNVSDVMLINADGTGLTNLTADIEDSCQCPHWSWDGTKITFDRAITLGGGGMDNDLYIMDADGGNKTLALGGEMEGQGDDTSPFFAPDGRWLVFQRLISMSSQQNPDDPDRAEIWKVRLSDGVTVQLTQQDTVLGEDDEVDETPTWSPDGTRIIFKRGLNEGIDLWACDAADGGGLTQVTTTGKPVGYAYYTFDGQHVFYYTHSGAISEETAEVYRMDPDGANRVQITSNAVADWDPAPSPRFGGDLPAAPTIALSPTNLALQCVVGANAAADEFLIRNSGGGGTLNYTVATNAAWLAAAPVAGACLYEQDPIALTFATAGLAAGDYEAKITVTAEGATNSPLELPIALHVKETWEDAFNAWKADKGLPEGQAGADDDPDNDTFDNLGEYVADTHPTNAASFLHIAAISNGPPVVVVFDPASAARNYTLQVTTNLATGPWEDVAGQGPRAGAGGEDTMTDDGAAAPARFYRIKVEKP